MKYIDITETVNLSVSQDNKDKCFKLTNMFFCGDEQVLRHQQTTQEHKDAHWNINAGRRVQLKIRVYEDGSMEILPVASRFAVTPARCGTSYKGLL